MKKERKEKERTIEYSKEEDTGRREEKVIGVQRRAEKRQMK